jgi:hypothetical protein
MIRKMLAHRFHHPDKFLRSRSPGKVFRDRFPLDIVRRKSSHRIFPPSHKEVTIAYPGINPKLGRKDLRHLCYEPLCEGGGDMPCTKILKNRRGVDTEAHKVHAEDDFPFLQDDPLGSCLQGCSPSVVAGGIVS